MVQMGYVGTGAEGEKEADDLVLRVFPRYVYGSRPSTITVS
jgi:hypothetical protein